MMTRVLVALSALLLASPAGAQALGEWDTDGDGLIDRAEFRAGLSDGTFERWDRDDDGQLGETEFADGVYALWDMDDDGALTVEEWDSAVDRWFGESTVDLSVAGWDDDGNGVISPEEFESAIADAGLFARFEADEDDDELLGEEEFADGIFGVADADEDMFLGEEEDWFFVDLVEALNAPDDDPALDAGEPDAVEPVTSEIDPAVEDADLAQPVGAVFSESFVGLPIPCGTDGNVGECRHTAERLCSVLGLGDPVDFLERAGALYAIRCDDEL